VKQITRLGKRPPGSDGKPRPILLHLDTEESKIKILRGAKNLRTTKEGERVFIHRDLTPKEQESRTKLLQELRNRKQEGETNLIIVKDRILEKRQVEAQ